MLRKDQIIAFARHPGRKQLDLTSIALWKDYCSKYVIVACNNDVDLFHRSLSFLKSINKILVPIIIVGHGQTHKEIDDPVSFQEDDKFNSLLEAIESNKSDLEYIFVGNLKDQVGGFNPFHEPYKNPFIDPERGLQWMTGHIQKLWERFEYLGLKLMISPMSFWMEREAYVYEGKLDDAPLRKFFIKKQAKVINEVTFQYLFKDLHSLLEILGRQYNYDMMSYNTWDFQEFNPVFNLNGKYKGDYPYFYLQDYLRSGIEVYSGFGNAEGAKSHIIDGVMNLGCTGVIATVEEADKPGCKIHDALHNQGIFEPQTIDQFDWYKQNISILSTQSYMD